MVKFTWNIFEVPSAGTKRPLTLWSAKNLLLISCVCFSELLFDAV